MPRYRFKQREFAVGAIIGTGAENRILVFFEGGSTEWTLVFCFLSVEFAVAFEFKLNVEILIDRKLRRKFGSLLAFESCNWSQVTFGKESLHFGMRKHAACNGVADFVAAFHVFTGVTPRRNFKWC